MKSQSRRHQPEVASSLERKTALFAAEVARGDVRRSSLNDFLKAVAMRPRSWVANLNRARAELITSFSRSPPTGITRISGLRPRDLTEQVVMSLRRVAKAQADAERRLPANLT